MYKYTKNVKNSLYVYKLGQTPEQLFITNKKFIDTLLQNNLTNYSGYKNAVEKKFKLSRLTPVYLDSKTCFIQTNQINKYECQLVNIKAIKEIKNCGKVSEITFLDETVISIPICKNTVLKKIKLAEEIEFILKKQKRWLEFNRLYCFTK